VDDRSYLPANDPTTSIKRAVVRVWPTFSGSDAGIGSLLGTGFVVRRQGDRAWILTARHVVRQANNDAMPTRVEVELYAGPLPPNLSPPRLEVQVSSIQPGRAGDDLILLEVRGIPRDLQPLTLASSMPRGPISTRVVGHPNNVAWSVTDLALLKAGPEELLLDGDLEQGASGGPVLNSAGEVVGLVYQSDPRGTMRTTSAYSQVRLQAIINSIPN
jgi:superkiller protein 3